MKPVRYNPSSAGFMNAGLAVTKYDSGCLRAILAKKNGAKTPFPPILAKMGAMFEDFCEEYLKTTYPAWTLEKEFTLKGPCIGLEQYEFSGRKDFTLRHGDECIIVECKSMLSKNSRLNSIRKGILNPSQIAQHVSYMIQEKVTRGFLMLGYYEIDPDTDELWCPHGVRDMYHPSKANFAVKEIKIRVDGAILVDGDRYDYNIFQSLEHRNAVLSILDTKKVASRPYNSASEYSSPCTYCTFKPACDMYDIARLSNQPETPDTFIENCKQAAFNSKPNFPKPFTPKRRLK